MEELVNPACPVERRKDLMMMLAGHKTRIGRCRKG
jgi:hypothetical protein